MGSDLAQFNRKLSDWLIDYNPLPPHHSLGLQSPAHFLIQNQPECQTCPREEDTGVIAIYTENGGVVGLETNQGAIRCDAIALCSGLWSRKNAAMV